MLLVPVKVDRSSIHGLGIFASQAIRVNTRIWSFTPGFDLDLDEGVDLARSRERQPVDHDRM